MREVKTNPSAGPPLKKKKTGHQWSLHYYFAGAGNTLDDITHAEVSQEIIIQFDSGQLYTLFYIYIHVHLLFYNVAKTWRRWKGKKKTTQRRRPPPNSMISLG